MPPSLLHLDKVQLCSTTDGTKASVTSSAVFHLPNSVCSINNDTLREALATRELWATLRKSFRVEFTIQVNGKRLGCHRRAQVLEPVGHRLRDASLWQVLSLTSSLEIKPKYESASPDIIIKTLRAVPVSDEYGNISEVTTVAPPESVINAELETVKISLELITPGYKSPRKRAKLPETETELKVYPCEAVNNGHTAELNDFETTVVGLRYLSSFIAECFRMPSACSREASIPPSEVSADYNNSRTSDKVPTLSACLLDTRNELFHDLPSPSNAQDIILRTDIRSTDILNPVSEDNQGDLVAEIPYTPPLTYSVDRDIAHPQSRSSIASLKRQLSTNTQHDELKDLSTFKSLFKAIPMAEIALNISLTGHTDRNRAGDEDFRIQRSFQSPICALVPAMLSSSFQQSLASNVLFLPAISNSICCLARNAQSPTLQQKLALLGTRSTSTLLSESHEVTRSGTSDRLSAVVQSRLWGMMQRHLHDSSTAKRIWQKRSASGSNDLKEDDDIDLLACCIFTDHDVLLDEEFLDLLEDEEEYDLLDYPASAEGGKLAVDFETEDLLLGGSWDADGTIEQQDFLTLDTATIQEMLL